MTKKFRKVDYVDKRGIRLTGGFWKERLDVYEKITIPDVLDKFEKDRGGAFNNFKLVKDRKQGCHAGPPFFDGLVAECIRGISDFLLVHYDKTLDERLDGYITLMAEAQDVSGDGYLQTYTTLICPEHRFGRDGGNLLWQHDLYNSGCIVEAGVHHYQATGKVNLLTVACKLANYVVKVIGPAPRENIVPAHPLPEEAYLKLYTLFTDCPELKGKITVSVQEEKYLELVKFWLDMRGHHNNRKSYPRYMGEYAQDHMPLSDQCDAAGHAVRAALLYTGLAEYVNITGDEIYSTTAKRIWRNITTGKMHVSGNIGAIHNEEKFGYEYQLPNTAYLETCAGVAMLFFARTMFASKGEGEYMDVLERVLYNGVLPGVSLNGNEYFYRNPLFSGGDEKRWAWHDCPCCPPMFLKAMGELPSYFYASDDEGLYANLYAASEVRISFAKGHVELIQQTCFPWEGSVLLKIKSCPSDKFKIRMRIPSYVQKFKIAINGETVSVRPDGGYAILEREWKTMDEIALTLEMKPFLVAAHPYVKDDEGRTALQMGPLLYCIEEADNEMENVVIPENYTLETSPSKDFPGITDICFEDTLRRKIRAIPYYAWANRTTGKMEVWLPVANYRKRSVEEWGDELYRPYNG